MGMIGGSAYSWASEEAVQWTRYSIRDSADSGRVLRATRVVLIGIFQRTVLSKLKMTLRQRNLVRVF